MTYNKPHDVTYTQMAIWIDNNGYSDSCDDIKLYEYIYHLLFIVAYEHKYFRYIKDYDDYAIQGASKLFLRLKDPRQFGENPQLKKIKSILNYIKTVSYPYKIDFEQTTYVEAVPENFVLHSDNNAISNYIAEETDIFDRIEFEASIGNITKMIHKYLSKSCYRSDSSEFKNIYISCILSILDSISLSADQLKSLNASNNRTINIDKVFNKIKKNPPILYHLDASMSNYIQVLIRELHHAIAKELSFETHSKLSAETSVKNLIIANLEDEYGTN